ncbi:DUF4129 domain-containing protein [Streptomyces sp. NPDC046928]|uniref:DUF4129 domain-containing protein n=1 Tax=Streptomyces TaxID=1883 RepID=UPI0033DA8C27
MSPTGGVLTAVPGLPGAAARALARAGDTAVRASAAASDDAPPLTTPRDPAREAARRELSKSMYHEDDPSWFQRALDTFWDWVEDLFDGAATATPGGPLGLVVVILVVLAVIGLLWWRLGTPRREPVSSTALFDDRPRSAADHRSAAEAHAAQGHWNRAVQERMRAIVRALEERALLDVRPGRTADEAAADAGRPLPSHADRLRAAAHAFDDVAYGGRTATRQTYQNLATLDRDLENTKPQLAAQASGTGPQDHQGAAG